MTTLLVGAGHIFAATAETFVGQVMLGGWVSLMVTVNEQVGPDVVEQFTVVVPTGKNEPDGGVQVTVPHPIDAVGANVTTAPH